MTSTLAPAKYRYQVDVPEGKSGNMCVERFEVPESSVENIRLAFQGRACRPGSYTRLIQDPHTFWMSDTTAEVHDHMPAIYQIRVRGGRVLINGLGLGMVVQAALACPDVTHVDVVERNADVIKLVGPTYASERCTIHHADAFTIKWPSNTHWSVAWHDIWPEICGDNLPEYAKLKRSYGRRVDWQGCWAEDILRAEQRRER